MFQLPQGFKGLDEAMQDVKAHGLATKKEKVIGLNRDGTRKFEVCGSDHDVECPSHLHRKCADMLLVHCHPTMVTELSGSDLDCIVGLNAYGNLAVCCQDETISWSQGYKGADNFIGYQFFVLPKAEDLLNYVCSSVAKQVGGVSNDKEYKAWQEKWEKTDDSDLYVLTAHLLNEKLAAKDVLIDYHVQVGEIAKTVLEKYSNVRL